MENIAYVTRTLDEVLATKDLLAEYIYSIIEMIHFN
jgi:hypothetical protein